MGLDAGVFRAALVDQFKLWFSATKSRTGLKNAVNNEKRAKGGIDLCHNIVEVPFLALDYKILSSMWFSKKIILHICVPHICSLCNITLQPLIKNINVLTLKQPHSHL